MKKAGFVGNALITSCLGEGWGHLFDQLIIWNTEIIRHFRPFLHSLVLQLVGAKLVGAFGLGSLRTLGWWYKMKDCWNVRTWLPAFLLQLILQFGLLGDATSIFPLTSQRNFVPFFITNQNMSNLSFFRKIAIAEGISYLLFALTMPLKYAFDQPLANKIVGMGHGILFIAFCVWGLIVAIERKWTLKIVALIFISSLLPFGTFIADKKILSKEN